MRKAVKDHRLCSLHLQRDFLMELILQEHEKMKASGSNRYAAAVLEQFRQKYPDAQPLMTYDVHNLKAKIWPSECSSQGPLVVLSQKYCIGCV